MKPVILLDLNFTLVANSDRKRSPFIRQIEGEIYRPDLIRALDGHHVILITARPAKYRVPTLHSIESKTGWHPDEAIFNDTGERPADFKRRVLRDQLLLRYEPGQLLGVESNPKTRAAYKALGVASVTWDQFLSGLLPS